MNQKLIAAAVAAVVVAPVASYGDSSFYGRINNAIDSNDLGDDSSTDISGVASRLGFRGNTDIGNGLTAHGRYEFSTVTDNEGTGIGDTRIATVGLSGAFGRVDVGNQWSSYYNTFGTHADPSYSLGYYIYSSIASGPYRTSNTIKYSNDFGPLHAELDVRLNESEEESDVAEKINGDGIGLGLSFAVTDSITLAAAFDSEDAADDSDDDDEDRMGLAVKASLGPVSAALGWQSYEQGDTEVDTTSLYVSGSFGEKTTWLLGYATSDDERLAADAVIEQGVYTEEDANGANPAPAGTATVPAVLGGNAEVAAVGVDRPDNVRTVHEITRPAVDAVTAFEDSEQLIWGVYHNFGGGLRVYYEATDLDTANHDGTVHLLGMRIDF